jgi:hypothetical protein
VIIMEMNGWSLIEKTRGMMENVRSKIKTREHIMRLHYVITILKAILKFVCDYKEVIRNK